MTYVPYMTFREGIVTDWLAELRDPVTDEYMFEWGPPGSDDYIIFYQEEDEIAFRLRFSL